MPDGYMDDLALPNRSMSQGEIRAPNYLGRSLNGVVVTRGLLMQSEFFANLNTTNFTYSPHPHPGSTTLVNDNPRRLNSSLCSS